jgi:CDP-diacylglycerol--serine O-phosphatidyltransferase
MFKPFLDPANLITMLGVICSAIAIVLVLDGHIAIAIALGLIAVLADHADGYVAVRTPNRSREKADIGRNFDGFGDLLYGAVLPAMLVVSLCGHSVPALVLAIVMIVVGAVRLSYFAVFGKDVSGRFVGVPLSYDMPLVALTFLVWPLLPTGVAPWCALAAFAVLTLLHVAPVRVPGLSRLGYTVIVGFALVSAGYLTATVLA